MNVAESLFRYLFTAESEQNNVTYPCSAENDVIVIFSGAQPLYSVDHTSFVGKCDIMDVRFCRNNDFVVSVSLSRNMGSGGASDYIDKSLIVATPIYTQADSIILDGLTGVCSAFSVSVDIVAAASNKSSTIKVFQVDREWGEMMKKSKVFIYRNPSYLEDIRSDGTVLVKCGQDLLVWQEGHNKATNVIRHGHTLTCLAAGKDRLIASGDHQGVLAVAYFDNPSKPCTPQFLEPDTSNYDIHAITIDNSESRVAALHNMGHLRVYTKQKDGQFAFSALVNYDGPYAQVSCMYFGADNTFVFGAKNTLKCYNIASNKLVNEIKNIGKEITLSAIDTSGTMLAAVDQKNEVQVQVVALSKNGLVKEEMTLFAATGEPQAICFAGEKQDCLAVGTSDNIICVYSIPYEDVLTYAFVYDQPTRLVYRNGIIFSGMKNGQFTKLRLIIKPRANEKASENLAKMRQTKKSVSNLVSAEELFRRFGFDDEDKNRDIVVKPKGLEAVMKPTKELSSSVDTRSSKFHKMSAAIISPDEIAEMARREEDRRKKIDAKMSAAIVLSKVLPLNQEKPSPSPRTKERRRKSFFPVNSPGTPTEKLPEVPIFPALSKVNSEPTILEERADENEKSKPKTQSEKKQKRSMKPPQSAKISLKGKKSAKEKVNSSATNQKTSRSDDETDAVPNELQLMKKLMHKTESSFVQKTGTDRESAKSSFESKVSKISKISLPNTSNNSLPKQSDYRKFENVLFKQKSLPNLKIQKTPEHSRKLSKVRFKSPEKSDLLQSIIDEYENTLKTVKSDQTFEPKLPKRKISSQGFSFHSRPSSSVNRALHYDCFPSSYDDEQFENPNFVHPLLKMRSQRPRTALENGWTPVEENGGGLMLKHFSTFELNTYYPMVMPRTKVSSGWKYLNEQSKFVCPIATVQVAPTEDFFDTELTLVKYS
ncbi:uncharacterized protein LOC142344433 isoform X2 [Convolutriloba macropyga]|uniref:uncharacterized protein LOC142344433 isoform X2 n=1 Tax=Convolutriloba macropyga TaxID=536237 RepID=UPI003F51F022